MGMDGQGLGYPKRLREASNQSSDLRQRGALVRDEMCRRMKAAKKAAADLATDKAVTKMWALRRV